MKNPSQTPQPKPPNQRWGCAERLTQIPRAVVERAGQVYCICAATNKIEAQLKTAKTCKVAKTETKSTEPSQQPINSEEQNTTNRNVHVCC